MINLGKRTSGNVNWGRRLETRDHTLGDELGLDVGSSGGELEYEYACARSAVEPFLFWKYLFFPLWFVIPEEFLLPFPDR